MHYFSNLFDKVLHMFRTVPPDDGQWTCPKHVEYFIK